MNQKYFEIIQKWAPINYQYVSNKHLGRDIICKVNVTGDWDTSKNRAFVNSINKNPKRISEIIPVVYYAIAKTKTHYFLLYSMYHADDDKHENDLEGCLVIIEKETNQLMGMITIAHLFFHKYSYNDNLVGISGENLDQMMVEDEEDHLRPLIEQEKAGHGLYSLSRRDFWGKIFFFKNRTRPHDIISYYPMNHQNQEIPGHDLKKIQELKGTPHYPSFYYKLIDILDDEDGFWNKRNNKLTFEKEGVFNAKDKPGKAHAPWAWDTVFDTLPAGIIWNDPAKLVKEHFRQTNGKEFSLEYDKKMSDL